MPRRFGMGNQSPHAQLFSCVKEWSFRDVNLVDWLCIGGGGIKHFLDLCGVLAGLLFDMPQ